MEGKKKKVGILTFHYAHNFGAALQAYALKDFLQLSGYDAQIVNYQNKRIRQKYQEDLPFWFAARRRDWALPWRWGRLLQSKKWRDQALEPWKRQCRRFEAFQKEFLLEGTPQVLSEKAMQEASGYDVLVFGSDQIWDLGITGARETVYWGAVGGSGKKVSYGASLYTKNLTRAEAKKAAKRLPEFASLSVREKTLADQLGALLGRDVEAVADPTLLIPKERYLGIVGSLDKREEPYSLAYMVSESEDLVQAAKRLGLPVKCLRYYKQMGLAEPGIEEVADAGPKEFLELLLQAEYVVTNSFHGVVFSILFGKKFCAVCKENARIENLLGIAGLERARASSLEEFGKEMVRAAQEANQNRVEDYAKSSKAYLLGALGRASKDS